MAFSSYGAFWISFVLLIQFFLPETAKTGGPLAANHAVAVYLLCWGWFTFYMWFGTFRINLALNLVFLTLWIAFLLLGIGALGHGHTTITHWGGYVTTILRPARLVRLRRARDQPLPRADGVATPLPGAGVTTKPKGGRLQ